VAAEPVAPASIAGLGTAAPWALGRPAAAKDPIVISLTSGNSLLSYLTQQTATSASSQGSGGATSGATTSAATNARVAATAQAALQAASNTHKASLATSALDKQQLALGNDLRAAMAKSGVKLSGDPIEFSVGTDGSVAVKANDADKAATAAFLKADTSRPSFAARIATQASDALKLSATIQQSAAISQAARYGGHSGGVMSLYTSLMQQSNSTPAVFSLSAGSSSLTYAGSLATKA
jgi:hypothetical protein